MRGPFSNTRLDSLSRRLDLTDLGFGRKNKGGPRSATVMWFMFYLFQEIDIEDEANCPYDFVEVFTGTGQQADSLGRFCGKRLPGTVTSRGHKMAIKFRSDKRLNFKGFRAQYTAGQ